MVIYSFPGSKLFYRNVHDRFHKLNGMHVHKKHELYFLEEGGTKYFVGNEIYILKPGDLVFVPKDVFHKTDRYECEEQKRVLIVFDDEFIGEEYLPFVEVLKEKKFVRIPVGKLHRLFEVFNKLEHEDEHMSAGYEELMKLYIRELLVLIVRYQSMENYTDLNESYQLIQNAAGYISEHYNTDLTLDLLARKFSLSKSYFSKLFKEVTGVGVSEYINISRVSAAEEMLLSGNMSITEVANRCGFNDSNYFATVFKKIKGVSPKKYSKAGLT